MRAIIAVGLLAGLSCVTIYSQSTGSISGTVTDLNGADIAGARIEAKETSTGVAWKTTTTDAGLYVLPTLPVGVYTLTVEHQGFRRRVQADLEVRVGLRENIDMALEIGEVQQTVEVTAEAPLLDTTKAERGQNVSPQLMTNL